MLESIVAEYLVQIILSLAGILGTVLSYYVKKVRNIDRKVNSISQELHGADGIGYIKRTRKNISSVEEDIESIDQKTDEIKNDMSRIEGKVNVLVDNIHDKDDNSYSSDDD